MSGPDRSGAAWAALAAVLLSVPFLGRAYHIDEPFFLAVARHALSDPWRPLDFLFNWYGESVPMSSLNNTPPVIYALLALAWKLTGGAEAAMRLLLLPLDAAAAAALYLLAARFLRRPLLPVLAVLVSPAYALTMGHLCPEKAALALGLWGLYACVRGVENRDPRWMNASAALLAGAALSKYHAAFLIFPAAGFALDRGVPLRRAAALAAAALVPAAVFVALSSLSGAGGVEAAWKVTAEAAGSWWSGPVHKGRSFFAFAGGALGAAGLWTVFIARRERAAWLGAGLAALLFLSAGDAVPGVSGGDRLLGAALAAAAGGALAWLFFGSGRTIAGWAVWAPWILGAALVQWGLYWAVLGRLTVFMTVPMILALAAGLEARLGPEAGRKLQVITLGATVVLTLALASVDFRYAAVQKEFAQEIGRRYRLRGIRVWYTGHWGFQHYLEEEGAVPLEHSRGGWDQAKPGDVVLWGKVNSNVLRPRGRRLANVRTLRIDHPLPLRLMSGETGQAGFYSSGFGFLPFAFSREPLEEFIIVEIL